MIAIHNSSYRKHEHEKTKPAPPYPNSDPNYCIGGNSLF